MKRIPDNAFEVLEFDKILEQIRSFCHGPKAAAACLQITPEIRPDLILKELSAASEAQRLLDSGSSVISLSYDDLDAIWGKLHIEGYILDIAEIMQIRRLLDLVHHVRQTLNEETRPLYPHLSAFRDQLLPPGPILATMDQVLDAEGQVRPDASAVLVRLSKDIQSVSRQCDVAFQGLVRQYASKGWLADTLETVRNDRRVLAVKAEFKRQIRGIIHDQSASGRTALIEPEEVIAINNDLFDLKAGFRAEVRRLLLAICNTLRTHMDALRSAERVIIELDILQAKGQLGKLLQAIVPVVDDTPRLSMHRAFHPLLVLRNRLQGRETVPFDLDLHAPNRLLLLSGPNAGGKSILMKAVGLLQLMVQSGIPVPVAQGSVFGIFSQISVSLGDHQSLQNDLSTYSSKLAEMRDCLHTAGEGSLVLIDEFGSGTDPRLGGAIAEGILDALVKRKVYGVITTHYSELKVFAYRTRGLVNGAMVFDKDKLAPTYELRIGKPGSSYTFEIAAKAGLPAEVLDYATQRTSGLHFKTMEDLLSDLEKQKVKLDKTLHQATQRSAQLDQLIRSYERMQNELTAQRYRLKLEQKEKDYAHLSQLNKELEASIRSIRAAKDLSAAKEKIKEVKQARAGAEAEIAGIHSNLRQQSTHTQKPFREGDHVRVHKHSQTGRIERIRKGKATVIMGFLRMDIPVEELTHADEPLQIRDRPSVMTDTEAVNHFDIRLDVRGMRIAEAKGILERFMDQALVANVPYVEIIHGKGTGALRRMVEDLLKSYPVRELSQPKDAQGGSGMTVVAF